MQHTCHVLECMSLSNVCLYHRGLHRLGSFGLCGGPSGSHHPDDEQPEYTGCSHRSRVGGEGPGKMVSTPEGGCSQRRRCRWQEQVLVQPAVFTQYPARRYMPSGPLLAVHVFKSAGRARRNRIGPSAGQVRAALTRLHHHPCRQRVRHARRQRFPRPRRGSTGGCNISEGAPWRDECLLDDAGNPLLFDEQRP